LECCRSMRLFSKRRPLPARSPSRHCTQVPEACGRNLQRHTGTLPAVRRTFPHRSVRKAIILVVLAVALPACETSSSDTAGSGASPNPFYSDPGIQTFPDEGHTHMAMGTVLVGLSAACLRDVGSAPDFLFGNFMVGSLGASFRCEMVRPGANTERVDGASRIRGEPIPIPKAIFSRCSRARDGTAGVGVLSS
jgi:hypothetical protein